MTVIFPGGVERRLDYANLRIDQQSPTSAPPRRYATDIMLFVAALLFPEPPEK